MRVHLFPSRTQKLSSFAPTILGGRLPGKIGNANIMTATERLRFSFAQMIILAESVHRTLSTPGQYVGLPGKIGNANIQSQTKVWLFFYAWNSPPDCSGRRDNTLAYPGRWVTPTYSPDRKVGAFFCLKHATGMFLNGRTILGLPGKIGNANIHRTRKCAVFLFILSN